MSVGTAVFGTLMGAMLPLRRRVPLAAAQGHPQLVPCGRRAHQVDELRPGIRGGFTGVGGMLVVADDARDRDRRCRDPVGLPTAAQIAQMTVGQRNRHCRKLRGWSHLQMILRMEIVAEGHRRTASTREGLRSKLSKWENDRVVPGQHNRRLLAETLGVTAEDLGLTQDPYFQR